jgi:hypothetical protein
VLGFHLLVHRSLLKLGSLPRWPPDTQPTPFDIPSTTLPSTFSLSPPLNYFTLTTLYSSRFKILLSLPPKPPATSPVFVLAPVSSFYRVYNLLKRIAEAYQAGSLANTADGPKVDVKLGDDSDSQRKAAARKLQNHELDTECPICMEAKVVRSEARRAKRSERSEAKRSEERERVRLVAGERKEIVRARGERKERVGLVAS